MTNKCVEKWLAKEVELNQRHEELLMRREAILRGAETYYDTQDDRAASFISDYSKAMTRNKQLLEDIKQCEANLSDDVSEPDHTNFGILKKNYWSMVKSIFPVWYADQLKYEQRVKSASSV
ncbi:hypothetical protein NP493_53g09030 [Ridgeia piscesae]|uniref:Uncharacterized protein n=1 Tax=Ridgeia piscesae TaxID=27915 RepID=A0AAD9PAX2_RIDPI|nr:hypothetical protein NP493_53g09030 [Ridgeia piscesae]